MKIETSKKLLLASYSIALVLTIFIILCTLLQIECSNLTMITSAAWVEVSATNIWYYKKAKVENVVKLMSSSISEEIKEKIDVNNLLNM